MLQINTFSIAARCPTTGMLGVAISTALPAVGALAVFVEAGVGAIATQAWVNPYLGIDGLALLRDGLDAEAALRKLIEADPGRDSRQVGMVDAAGRAAGHTGSACPDWNGHIIGDGFTVQGNLLRGRETVEEMAEIFAASAGDTLPERLMLALEAGQAAGGDKRGRQSAALKVVHTEAYPWLDLRADAHTEPVAELRRLYELSQHQLMPFLGGLPTRTNPQGLPLGDDVIEMLMKSPQDRRER